MSFMLLSAIECRLFTDVSTGRVEIGTRRRERRLFQYVINCPGFSSLGDHWYAPYGGDPLQWFSAARVYLVFSSSSWLNFSISGA